MSQRFLTSLFMAFLTVFLLNTFFFKGSSQKQSLNSLAPGQAYRIPTEADLKRPALKTVTFEKTSAPERTVTVGNDIVQATVSSHGGALQSLSFTKHKNKKHVGTNTIDRLGDHANEQQILTLALDDQTPLEYDISVDAENPAKAVASVRSRGWDIEKTFYFNPDSYKVDVTLSFAPRSSSADAIRPRVFLPVPFMTDVVRDRITGTSSSGKDIIQTTGDKLTEQAWVLPQLFGGMNTYFAHMLIADKEQFAQRGFYKKYDDDHLAAIIEGPELTEAKTFSLSFYLGPKQAAYLHKADPRLETLVIYGWFKPITRTILYLLGWIYDYTHNYGWAIILLTILLRLLILPLSLMGWRQIEMQQKLRPQVSYIQKKYRGEPARMQQELMALYARHNLSPFSMLSGPLMMIPQFIVLIWFSGTVGSAVELYNAPFIGWITDLSSKDPYYVLPISFGLLMMAHGASMKGSGGTSLITYLMPLIAMGFFAGVSTAVLLFMVTAILFSLFEGKIRAQVS